MYFHFIINIDEEIVVRVLYRFGREGK